MPNDSPQCDASEFPVLASDWIREVRTKGFRELRDAGDFDTLDRKLSKALWAQLTGTLGQDIRQEEERMESWTERANKCLVVRCSG